MKSDRINFGVDKSLNKTKHNANRYCSHHNNAVINANEGDNL